jgi:hypothetical protein
MGLSVMGPLLMDYLLFILWRTLKGSYIGHLKSFLFFNFLQSFVRSFVPLATVKEKVTGNKTRHRIKCYQPPLALLCGPNHDSNLGGILYKKIL